MTPKNNFQLVFPYERKHRKKLIYDYREYLTSTVLFNPQYDIKEAMGYWQFVRYRYNKYLITKNYD